jgi:hypothetical protein
MLSARRVGEGAAGALPEVCCVSVMAKINPGTGGKKGAAAGESLRTKSGG